ncbi:hypothetical protein ILUMI_06294 [Ignelater luminosus]|uniref:HAT C-terminal dimerisation domain-containing protein n=1 Tax=Ignelater luminosus TaxID=2038154 RepID=A0A8K0GHD0_IGNLU|nr:hypothetical protein ILUMI_06294 [Ignelater luminosus]
MSGRPAEKQNGQQLEQCISLRGHRNSGPIDSVIDPIGNDGDSKATLRSKLGSGDEILKLHLEPMSRTATYLNISYIEQFSLCFRFYNLSTMKIEESFLKFVPVTNLTRQSLANVLITTLEGLNIDSKFMVGQVWKENNKTPKTAMDALAFLLQNNTKFFPKVEALIKIFVTIHVTTVSNERTFATIRRLKTYLRNTTREDRLNGLALLSIHREIPVSVDEVINLFSKQKNRRQEFFEALLEFV